MVARCDERTVGNGQIPFYRSQGDSERRYLSAAAGGWYLKVTSFASRSSHASHYSAVQKRVSSTRCICISNREPSWHIELQRLAFLPDSLHVKEKLGGIICTVKHFYRWITASTGTEKSIHSCIAAPYLIVMLLLMHHRTCIIQFHFLYSTLFIFVRNVFSRSTFYGSHRTDKCYKNVSGIILNGVI